MQVTECQVELGVMHTLFQQMALSDKLDAQVASP